MNDIEQTKEDINSNQEIDLLELLEILLHERIKIIIIISIFAISSVFYALWLPDRYTAHTILAPAEADSGGIARTLGNMSGLASLAGVNIESEANQSQLAQEIMKSWSFMTNFVKENNIAPEIVAATDWNRSNNSLIFDEDIYDIGSNAWYFENPDGSIGPPSSWEIFKAFTEKLSVVEDKESGLVSVTLEHYSPEFAKKWLDLYIRAINFHMQQRKILMTTNNINYLEDQINQTSIKGMKEIFFSVIQEQIKEKMMAKASPDYVFISVAPSMVPEEKSAPNRAVICILITMLGTLIAFSYAFINHYFIKRDNVRSLS